MKHQVYLTGLKAVDLFAPLPLGGDILVTGEPKSAPRVLGTELAYRLSHQPGRNMHVTVFLDSSLEDAGAYETEFRESVVGGAEIAPQGTVTADDIRRHLTGFKSDIGSAVLAVTKTEQFIADFRKAVKAARGSTVETAQLTSIVVTENIYPTGFDAQVKLIRALAVEGIYPPLDVRETFSSSSVGPEQREVAGSIKSAVTQILAAMPPGGLKDPNWVYNQNQSKQPVVQALRFISQPYFCAEPYTGIKSAYVPVEETVASFRKILSGAYLQLPIQSFYMKNGLPGDLSQAVAN